MEHKFSNPWANKIDRWYHRGLWTAEMVQQAVPKLITQEEANAILK